MISLLLVLALAQDPPAEVRPVMVYNAFIDPFTGKARGLVEEAEHSGPARPLPGKAGGFELSQRRERSLPLHADAALRSAVESSEPCVIFADRTLMFFKDGRKKIWQAELSARGGTGRPPDSVVGAGAVIVAHAKGLAAYDLAGGRRLWDVPGVNGRLRLFQDLVLAVDCSSKKPGEARVLVARRLSDGSEAWKVELLSEEEPEDVTTAGHHALVRTERLSGGKPSSLLIDAQGAVVLRLDEFVQRILPSNGGWLLLSGTRLARILPGGKAAWETAVKPAARWPFDALDVLVDDDRAYVFRWGRIDDSGVEVTRLNPATGEVAWTSACADLRVDHSKYWHVPYVELRDEKLVVVSQGAGGWFIETLATKDGKQVSRFSGTR